jgi:hypothetical protein
MYAKCWPQDDELFALAEQAPNATYALTIKTHFAVFAM